MRRTFAPGTRSRDGRRSTARVTKAPCAGPSGRVQLDCLEQAILLALAEQQKRASARDELQPWQVAAFADSVLAQPKTLFTLRCTAKLFRWEDTAALAWQHAALCWAAVAWNAPGALQSAF